MKRLNILSRGLLAGLLICSLLGLSACGQKGPLVPPPAALSSLAR